eukprot:scaffold15643_cov61-Phaeocystis_antarctica.AAC.1
MVPSSPPLSPGRRCVGWGNGAERPRLTDPVLVSQRLQFSGAGANGPQPTWSPLRWGRPCAPRCRARPASPPKCHTLSHTPVATLHQHHGALCMALDGSTDPAVYLFNYFQFSCCSLHGLRLAPAAVRCAVHFLRRRRAKHRSPLVVRGRLHELRCRARPRLPSATLPAQHLSPHGVGSRIVRCQAHDRRRQRLELLVVPPLRLGHLSALRQLQLFEGRCRGLCPELRAGLTALPGLEVPLRRLHLVPRG